MALQGPSGSGKTYSSLLLAYGITKDWSKIAVIDSENHSAELYSSLGPYYVCPLTSPFTPEQYMDAIRLCEKSDIEVVIIDSVTHEWEHLLDYHANLPGNSFTAWAKVTPRHNAFIQAIMQSSCHVICTVRTKQDYILVEKNGKQVPEGWVKVYPA
ncbi:AAA family ATPase [Daejeonella oryzae]|uniref:AAA family ATPase n=1 Tax=Daejeonella oryzae TaxID=1122943 RepID=UPI001FDF59B5|nr:AAA family ATPase [Daejeonella oryzae]